MSEVLEAKKTVLEICQKLIAKGILMGTGGNISVRVNGQKAFAITPSNFDYAKMVIDDICVLAWDLSVIEGQHKPSVESSMHAAIYEHRSDTNCVIHTHQVYASALALTHTPIPALYDEQIKFLGRSVEIVDYAPSGTPFLKNNVVKRLSNHANAYILQNHGALLLGPDPDRTIFNVQLLEKCAVTFILAICTEKKISNVPAPFREIAFMMLRKDQKKTEKANQILEDK
ncbi:MAG: class II aldolase/adducin family protein [Anaerolineaceae bacterium]